jgi:hypothetical protein
MENLLQRPFRGSPATLLRGDDYFLPRLHDAIRRLSEDWNSTPCDEHPVDLMITTTLLHGARTVSADSLGQQLPQRQHEVERERSGGPNRRATDCCAGHGQPAGRTVEPGQPYLRGGDRGVRRAAASRRGTRLDVLKTVGQAQGLQVSPKLSSRTTRICEFGVPPAIWRRASHRQPVGPMNVSGGRWRTARARGSQSTGRSRTSRSVAWAGRSVQGPAADYCPLLPWRETVLSGRRVPRRKREQNLDKYGILTAHCTFGSCSYRGGAPSQHSGRSRLPGVWGRQLLFGES